MIQIRKCEKVIVWRSSEVANLNPDKFRDISIPFRGDSEQGFLIYIKDNISNFQTILHEFDNETKNELEKLSMPYFREYANNFNRNEDNWLESGVETDIGFFETYFSSK